MSADEQTPPSNTEPAPSDPPVQVVAVNLADILSGKVRLADIVAAARPLSRIDIVASALAVVQLLKEASESNPRQMERILAGAWLAVERRLEGGGGQWWRVDALVLAEYFRHAGDWGAITRCLRNTGEGLPEPPGEFQTRYDDVLTRARASLQRMTEGP